MRKPSPEWVIAGVIAVTLLVAVAGYAARAFRPAVQPADANSVLAAQVQVLSAALAVQSRQIDTLLARSQEKRSDARRTSDSVDVGISRVVGAAGDSAAVVVEADSLRALHDREVARYEAALAVDDSIIAAQQNTIDKLYQIVDRKDAIIAGRDAAEEAIRRELAHERSSHRRDQIIGAGAVFLTWIVKP